MRGLLEDRPAFAGHSPEFCRNKRWRLGRQAAHAINLRQEPAAQTRASQEVRVVITNFALPPARTVRPAPGIRALPPPSAERVVIDKVRAQRGVDAPCLELVEADLAQWDRSPGPPAAPAPANDAHLLDL